MNLIKRNAEYDNRGFSLVELLVVIAIMGILVGGVTLGIGIVFSKDAARCATRLNDAIYTTRMESMSKEGAYTLTINKDAGGKYMAEIDNGSGIKETFDLEGNGKSIDEIKCTYSEISGEWGMPIVISFDKSKGNVYKITANGANKYEAGSTEDGVVCFDIKPLRGNKLSKVKLVTGTGKHTIGDF